MPFILVTGVEELDRKLRAIAGKAAERASKRAVKYTGDHVARGARKAAPKGPTGNLRRQIKFRWQQEKGKGVTGGKVTVGSRHGHLVTLGTKKRFRKHIGGKFEIIRADNQDFRNKGTGAARPNPFFRLYIQSTQGQTVRIMQARLKLYLEQEIEKVT